MKRILGLAAMATVVAMAAHAADTAKPADKAASRRQCFYSRNISSWSPVNDSTINLRVGVNDYYQVKLLGPCPDIDWAQGIGLESRGSDWICDGLDVTVIVPRTTIGPQRCNATSLHKLTAEEVAALPPKQKP
jgi:hypothetical protein